MVPVYEKAIPGPVSVGTRFREVVRLLPFLKGEVISEVTGCDPPHRFDYSFVAFGNMDGELTYRLEPVGGGGRVVQRQTLRPRGTLLKLLSPVTGAAF